MGCCVFLLSAALMALLLLPKPVLTSKASMKKPDHYCKVPPTWDAVNSTNPMARFRSNGEVVVLLLTEGDCYRCKTMIYSLASLSGYLQDMRWDNIRFVVVSNKMPERTYQWLYRKSKYLDHLQIVDNSTLYKDLGGRTKDTFVYDGCGRLQFQLKFPYSYPGYPYLKAAIWNAFKFPHYACGKCLSTATPQVTQAQGQLTDIQNGI